MIPAGFHHFTTHFPIALFFTVAVIDIWRLLRPGRNATEGAPDRFSRSFPYLLVAAAMSVLSIASGLWAESYAPGTESVHEAVEVHEQFGFITVALIVGLTLWRVALRGGRPRKAHFVYVALALVTLAVVVVTAVAGHEVVIAVAAG